MTTEPGVTITADPYIVLDLGNDTYQIGPIPTELDVTVTGTLDSCTVVATFTSEECPPCEDVICLEDGNITALADGDPNLVLLPGGHNPVQFGVGVPVNDSEWRD